MAVVVSTTTFAQQPQTGTAVVAGRVMDQVSGNPVGGASVTLASVAAATPAGAAGAAVAERTHSPRGRDGQ